MPQLAVGVGVAAIAGGATAAAGATTAAVITAIQIGLTIGMIAGQALFPTNTLGPQTTDFRPTNSAYGQPIPFVYGSFRTGGNIMQAGPVIEHSQTHKIGIGADTTTFTYTQTFAVLLCEGVIDQVLRIWADKTLILDRRNSNLGPVQSVPFDFKVYTGTEDQEPDTRLAYLSSGQQITSPFANTTFGINLFNSGVLNPVIDSIPDLIASQPAYRGTAYIVLYDFPLTPFGNRIPVLEFEVVKNGEIFWPKKIHQPIMINPNTGNPMELALWFYKDPANPYVYTNFVDLTTAEWDQGLARYNILSGELDRARLVTFANGGNFTNVAYYAPLVVAPEFDALYMMYQDTFTSYFIQVQASTLIPIQYSSDSSGVLQSKVQADHLVCTADGLIVAACGVDPVVRPWIALWSVGLTATATYFYTEDLGPGNSLPSHARSLAFDASDMLWVGCDNGELCGYFVSWDDHSLQYHFSRKTVNAPSNSPTAAITDMVFVPSTGELILWYENQDVVRWSTITNSATSDVMHDPGYYRQSPFSAQPDAGGSQRHGWTDDPHFGGQINVPSGDLIIFNAETGESTNYPLSNWSETYASMGAVLWDNDAQCFWVARGALTDSANGGIAQLFLNRGVANGVTLQSICEDLCQHVGMSADMYDFTALTQVVRGFIVDQRITAAAAIGALQPAYFFDVVEVDWVLKGINRGGDIQGSIADDRLGATDQPSTKIERLTSTRTVDKEIPSWIDYVYLDYTLDYLSGSQPARRAGSNVFTENRATINIPVVMTPSEAASAALRYLYALWSARETYQIQTGPEYIKFHATDRVTIERNNRQLEARITKDTIGSNLLVTYEAVTEDDGVYSATAKGNDVSGFIPSSLDYQSPPQIVLLDTALLRASDDTPGMYASAGPVVKGVWAGARIQKSSERLTFTDVAFEANIPTLGTAATILANNSRWTIWDRTNTVDVHINAGGILSNASENDLVDDPTLNVAFLGGEIIQFAVAENLGDGVWRLSVLLRARLGTEAFVGTHAIGDDFIMLTPYTVQTITWPAAEMDQTRYYRALTGGIFPISPIRTTTQPTRRLLPYAPYFIKGARDGGLNLTITWQRRSRVAGGILTASPLFETIESYQIDILNGASVVRTLTTILSPNGSGVTDTTNRIAVYEETDQVIDFGSAQAEISMNIYQLNAVRGRGYPGAATI